MLCLRFAGSVTHPTASKDPTASWFNARVSPSQNRACLAMRDVDTLIRQLSDHEQFTIAVWIGSQPRCVDIGLRKRDVHLTIGE